MRVIKPLRLSINQRVLTVRRAHHLSVGLLVYFPFEAPGVALPEVSLWRNIAPIVGKDAILDEGLPKPCGEVLVFGKAYSPGGEPRPAFSARVQMGTVDKTIFVVGRRRWENGVPTEPEPITEMPITWENAFGGPDFPANPTGMGAGPIEEDGKRVHYLPHLEDPRHLLQSPSARPPPACFVPLDPGRPQRMEKMGTYGQQWVETEFPGFARDLDPEYFMVAPEDQRLGGYLEGGEAVTLENLHPSMPRLTTEVPRLRARCLVEQGGEPLRDVPTRLETLLLFPSIARGIALFRGIFPVAEDDAADVTLMLAALERAGSPKPMEHYRAVLAQRLDKEKGHLYGLRDRDLMPEPDGSAPTFADEVLGDMEALIAREGIAERRMRARAQRDLDQARMDLRVLGVDPDEKLPREVPQAKEPPKPEDLAEYFEDAQAEGAKIQADIEAEAQRELDEAEVQRTRMEDETRKTCARLGVDYDELKRKNTSKATRPPRFSAEAELARMRELAEVGRKLDAPIEDLEAKLADPSFIARLRAMEEAELMVYRCSAHLMPPADAPDAEAQAAARAEVERALAAGEPLARRDLTGIDLRGLSFAKCDLREALLEGADLSGCDLSGAVLAGAVLVRAELGGARLEGADLSGVNLGEAKAEGADLTSVNLRKAVLWKTKCAAARFVAADLRETDLMETLVAGADFSAVEAGGAIFYENDLTGARFTGAKLQKTTFFQCKGADIDFAAACLEQTGFVGVQAEGVSFRGASAASLRVVSTSALRGADFSGAKLEGANLRGVDLTGANFEGASADGADFSEAILRGARITGVSAIGTRFMRSDLTDADLTGTNLMDGLLLKAKLAGAKLEKVNLFRANLAHAKGDDRTSFAGSLVKRVLYTRQNG